MLLQRDCSVLADAIPSCQSTHASHMHMHFQSIQFMTSKGLGVISHFTTVVQCLMRVVNSVTNQSIALVGNFGANTR
jgi:hypothetical protein